MRRLLVAVGLLLPLAGCVTDTPDVEQVEYAQVSGVIAFKEKTLLPDNSRIVVAVVDANKRGTILMQTEFSAAKLPVPFFLSTPKEKYDDNADYVVWAAVNVDGLAQPLLQTRDPFVRVLNNGVTNALVEVKAPAPR
ncbi:YbaY family lipoprotein [Ferrimonas senticii]|uniref:YbaY family lipoprotein n=1 Tax=Ferrimonas senticii TaxID=394566 RepID=UPI00042A1000|nr:YbaY family lipoprotein [Ferrimonas senticii]